MSSKKLHSNIDWLVKRFTKIVDWAEKHAQQAQLEIEEIEDKVFDLQKEKRELQSAKDRAKALSEKLKEFIV